ncbi:ATP-grasp domain-containing protein, partial [uncultured Campylobacter sp.]|uniref:ATP-grasp domain-containing protein n=1 Tax=uncultured Campylobacter sp. TaxID=218934 RepID=UPI002632C4A7
MNVKIAKFHRMSRHGKTSNFDQNPGLHGAAKARMTSFKFSRSAKLRYSEDFKFSHAIEYELSQTAHLKSTPKEYAPYVPKSRCNEAHCENTLPRHTQRTKKNPPKRCKSRAIKILPQQYTVKFRYKDRCGEPKCYAQRTANFIFSAEQSLGYEFKFSRAMNQVAYQAKCIRQGVAINFKFNCVASYKFNQTARRMAASKQCIWRFAEISSQRRTQQISEISSRLYAQQKIKIPSQQYARRSLQQTAEISPRQCARQAARIPQNYSLPRSAKILLLRHMHGAEIASELYVALLLDRAEHRYLVMCSREGGMDIET